MNYIMENKEMEINHDVSKTVQNIIDVSDEAQQRIADKFEEFDREMNNMMGDADNAKADDIVNALKGEHEKGIIDLSELKGDKRLPDEDFADYKTRIKREKKLRERYSRGQIKWQSIFDGPKKGQFKAKKSD